MALTRSSYKCCISGIGLSTTEAYRFTEGQPRVIHARLWNAWKQKHGEDFMPDGMPTKETLTWPPNFRDQQHAFILQELVTLKAEILVDHNVPKEQQAHVLKYTKVLFSWFLIVDAQCALIELNKFIESIQLFIVVGPTELSETCLNLLQMMMVSVFNEPTQAEVIASFDDIQPAVTSTAESAIWRYIILANGIVNAEPADAGPAEQY